MWFKRDRHPGLESISFDLTDWHMLERKKDKKVYTDDPQVRRAILCLTFQKGDPSVPVDLDDLAAVRNTLRSYANAFGAGFMKADVHEIQGVKAVEWLTKLRREPHGIDYFGCLIMPFKAFWYQLAITGQEVGYTGMREAMLGAKFGMEALYDVDESTGEPQLIPKHQPRDPYDQDGQYCDMPTFFEQEQFDSEFPLHPLSLVRRSLAKSIATMVLADDLLKHKP